MGKRYKVAKHERVKKKYDTGFDEMIGFIKEYYYLIWFTPLFIGGFFQFIILMRINADYVKFFSIGQLLSDGLLILLIISATTLSTLFLIFFLNFLTDLFKNRYEKLKHNVFNSLTVILIIGAIFMAMYGIINRLTSNEINENVVNCTIRKDYGRSIDYYKIKYMNDKYLFINLIRGEEVETVIYPLEILFNFDCLNN